MKGSTILIGVMSLILVALVGLIVVLVIDRPKVDPVPKDPDKGQIATTDNKHQKQATDGKKGTNSQESKPSAESTKPKDPEPVVAKPNEQVQTAKVQEAGNGAPPPPAPKPIANPQHIEEVRKQGKTYESTIKAGFVAKVYTEDWGVREEVSLTYMAEGQVSDHIESNDGRKIVARRHIQYFRNVALEARVDNVSINLGLPGVLVLGLLESYIPGTVVTVETVQPIAEAILKGASQLHLDSATAKAKASVDSMSGKTVRIEYVDGIGVTSLQPVDCTLTQSEFDYLSAAAVLSDCYIFPKAAAEEKSWSVDGAQLADVLLDPTLRGRGAGQIRIARDPDEESNGRRIAKLRITSGTVTLDSSDDKKRQIGTFTPRGIMRYDLQDGYVMDAEMKGDAELVETSKDHILFKAEFSFRPQLQVQYSCKMR